MSVVSIMDVKMRGSLDRLMDLKIKKREIEDEIRDLQDYAIAHLDQLAGKSLVKHGYKLSLASSPTRYDYSSSKRWIVCNERRLYVEKCMKAVAKDDMKIIDPMTGDAFKAAEKSKTSYVIKLSLSK